MQRVHTPYLQELTIFILGINFLLVTLLVLVFVIEQYGDGWVKVYCAGVVVAILVIGYISTTP